MTFTEVQWLSIFTKKRSLTTPNKGTAASISLLRPQQMLVSVCNVSASKSKPMISFTFFSHTITILQNSKQKHVIHICLNSFCYQILHHIGYIDYANHTIISPNRNSKMFRNVSENTHGLWGKFRKKVLFCGRLTTKKAKKAVNLFDI